MTFFTKISAIFTNFHQNLHLKHSLFSIFCALRDSNIKREENCFFDLHMTIIRMSMGVFESKSKIFFIFCPSTPFVKWKLFLHQWMIKLSQAKIKTDISSINFFLISFKIDHQISYIWASNPYFNSKPISEGLSKFWLTTNFDGLSEKRHKKWIRESRFFRTVGF